MYLLQLFRQYVQQAILKRLNPAKESPPDNGGLIMPEQARRFVDTLLQDSQRPGMFSRLYGGHPSSEDTPAPADNPVVGFRTLPAPPSARTMEDLIMEVNPSDRHLLLNDDASRIEARIMAHVGVDLAREMDRTMVDRSATRTGRIPSVDSPLRGSQGGRRMICVKLPDNTGGIIFADNTSFNVGAVDGHLRRLRAVMIEHLKETGRLVGEDPPMRNLPKRRLQVKKGKIDGDPGD